MGQIVVDVELENTADRGAFEEGLRAEPDIRRTVARGIVDAGAVILVLPQNIVERLGIRTRRTVVVTYADERKEERPVAGPVTLQIGDRSMSIDCIVGPPFGETLVGQVVLATLDLIADCREQTLLPRMPDYPLLNLK